MASKAEEVLFAYLTDTEAVDTLTRVGLPTECITVEPMRDVVIWVIDRYFESGRISAPSKEAIMAEWGQVVEDAEVQVGSEHEIEDTITWAIDYLKNQFLDKTWQDWSKTAAREIMDAQIGTKVDVFTKHLNELATLSLRLSTQENRAVLSEGLSEALADYNVRATQGHVTQGLTFGLDQIDAWTYGIHEGELAILAAGPKVGKSWLCARTALHEVRNGRCTVLFTLENSVKMTYDRMACDVAAINYRRWQRGECNPEEVERVQMFLHDVVPTLANELHVIQPEPGQRNVTQMVRQAQILGAQSIVLDQLTFIEPPDFKKSRTEQVREITHDLKTLISTGSNRMSCLLAHQINREGVKAAKSIGHLEMFHLAEGSETERTADWIFGLFQSDADRTMTEAKFQIMGARREDTNAWQLMWRPALGVVNVIREVALAA